MCEGDFDNFIPHTTLMLQLRAYCRTLVERKDSKALFGKRIKREQSKLRYVHTYTCMPAMSYYSTSFLVRHVTNFLQNHEAVVKALAEDPSVFEYDNIYDDLQEKKKKSDPRLQKKDTRVCIL